MKPTMKRTLPATNIARALSMLLIAVGSGPLVMAAGPRPQEEQVAGPAPNLKVTPVAATWQYSNDGGKTFSGQPLPGPPTMAKPHKKEPP